MKKTVIINISGIVFHIDEDAFEKLKGYLDSLNHYFGNTTESKEIVTDIESRIAELLQPKINDIKQSVTIEDIEEILSILGSPEDIAASDNSSYESEASRETEYPGKRASRRLYRDIENSKIGGVCSGLGAYFDVDPVIFRIILFVLVFAGGISFLIYPILWIAVPAARTSAQKLEMKGKDINLSNIEKTVREDSNARRSHSDTVGGRISDFLHEIFSFIGVVLKGIFHVFRYLFGIFFILMAIGFSIAIIGGLYFKNFSFHGNFNEYFTSAQDFLYYFINPVQADTMLLLAVIILILPITGLIYLGLRLLFRFQTRQKWIVLALSVLWILCALTFTILIFNEVDNFRSENTTREIVSLKSSSSNILYINTPSNGEKEDDFIRSFNHSRLFFPVKPENSSELAGIARIDIEKTNATVPELEIVREARGEDRSEALVSARKIKVNYTQKDSVLDIDPFFRVPNDQHWKFYYTKIIIRIPVGTKIFLDENTLYLLDNIHNVNDYWDQQMVNKTWTMTDNGLELMGSNLNEIKSINSIGNRVLNMQVRDRYGIDRGKLDEYKEGEKYGQLTQDGKKYYYGTINLDVRKSETEKIEVELVKTSSGGNSKEAAQLANAILYSYEQNDSVLWMDPIFRFPENCKWSDQKVKVILRIPIHQKIYLNKEFEPLIENMAQKEDKWTGDYINETMEMANEGLVKVEK